MVLGRLKRTQNGCKNWNAASLSLRFDSTSSSTRSSAYIPLRRLMFGLSKLQQGKDLCNIKHGNERSLAMIKHWFKTMLLIVRTILDGFNQNLQRPKARKSEGIWRNRLPGKLAVRWTSTRWKPTKEQKMPDVQMWARAQEGCCTEVSYMNVVAHMCRLHLADFVLIQQTAWSSVSRSSFSQISMDVADLELWGTFFFVQWSID